MAVPYTFGTATAAIPLSQLDSNFATPITLGNTAIQLGNTVTTIEGLTLANVTINTGNVTITNISVTTANVTTANLTTAVITTANVTTANITNIVYSGTLTGGTGVVNLGSGQFYKNASGNVGIGVTTPTAKLDLYDTTNPVYLQQTRGSVVQLTGPTGTAVTSPGQIGTTSNSPFRIITNNTDRVRIDETGNVGIGTTAPSQLLNVEGSSNGSIGALIYNSNNLVNTEAKLELKHNRGNVNSSVSVSAVANSGGTADMKFVVVGTERMRIDSSGNVLVTGAGGLGYGTGSGGAVTQLTSRTTGVTLNKTNGAITMFSAAGSATAATFTVTNSTVAATDTIILNQKSGTNLYVLLVTAVAAGSFNVTFYTTGGTATDAPVLNFAVIKAVVA